MKKRFSVILALVILALAVIQLPLAAYADITMVEVTKGASIRSKPGYDGAKLTLAKAGEQYLHLGTEGSWYALQMQDGRTGYLPADSCRLVTAAGIPTGSTQDAYASILNALKKQSGFEQNLPATFSGKTVMAIYYDTEGKPKEVSTESLAEKDDFWQIPKEVLAADMKEADWALLVYPTLPTGEDEPIRVNVFAVDVRNTVFYAPYTAGERETRLANGEESCELTPMLEDVRDIVFYAEWEKAMRVANDEDYQAGLQYMKEEKYFSAYESFGMSSLDEAREMAEQCVQKWPRTGEIWHNPAFKSNSMELTVSVNQSDEHAMLVRIYQKDQLAACLFIGGTGRATAKLPAGTYVIKDGVGTEWFGLKEAFGRNGSYETMTFGDDDAEEVRLQANHAYTITINVSDHTPGADSVGSEYEDWESFAD